MTYQSTEEDMTQPTEEELRAADEAAVAEDDLVVDEVNSFDSSGEDVDAPESSGLDLRVDQSEVDEAPAPASAETTPAKTGKQPKRGDLPEGYVTPVGLAKALTEHYKSADPSKLNPQGVFPSQMVYSYIKNAPKDRPFPSETIEDSLGVPRSVVKLEAGLQWFKDKDAAKAERARVKAEKEATKAAKPTATTPTADAPVEEAE